MPRATPVTLTLALGLAIGACGAGDSAEGEGSPETTATPPAAAAAPTARAMITSPVEGAEVSGDVTIMLGAEGVTVEAATGTREAGRGHHHLFVDTDLTPAGEPIPGGVPGIIHIGTGASEYELPEMAPGEHTIIAVLAYGDHVPMEGVATDTLHVTVTP